MAALERLLTLGANIYYIKFFKTENPALKQPRCQHLPVPSAKAPVFRQPQQLELPWAARAILRECRDSDPPRRPVAITAGDTGMGNPVLDPDRQQHMLTCSTTQLIP